MIPISYCSFVLPYDCRPYFYGCCPVGIIEENLLEHCFFFRLSLLAVLVPCLCLYPMLTACYTCARACHVCGGKHVPV